MICLDTNAVIAAINRRVPGVRAHLEQALADGVVVGIPAIVLYELWYGIKKSRRPSENTEMLRMFLTLGITPWSFDAEDAGEAGEIRAAMERAGTPIGSYDILVAAQARRRGALLVTANTREFRRVPRLHIQDWSL